MAFDEKLAKRIDSVVSRKRGVTQKKMFGGMAFMLDKKMFCGVLGNNFVARIGPEQAANELKSPNVTPMDFTGRPMKGYVYVAPAGTNTDAKLHRWIDLCVSFVSDLTPRKKSRK